MSVAIQPFGQGVVSQNLTAKQRNRAESDAGTGASGRRAVIGPWREHGHDGTDDRTPATTSRPLCRLGRWWCMRRLWCGGRCVGHCSIRTGFRLSGVANAHNRHDD